MRIVGVALLGLLVLTGCAGPPDKGLGPPNMCTLLDAPTLASVGLAPPDRDPLVGYRCSYPSPDGRESWSVGTAEGGAAEAAQANSGRIPVGEAEAAGYPARVVDLADGDGTLCIVFVALAERRHLAVGGPGGCGRSLEIAAAAVEALPPA